MSRFDVRQKIPLSGFFKALGTKTTSQYEILNLLQNIGLTKSKNISSFAFGRVALYWLIKYRKIKRIVFPAFICPYLPMAAKEAGAEVVFCDVAESDYNISIDKPEIRLKEGDAIFGVHTFGAPLDSKKIRKICDEKEIIFIEDCAHALYSEIDGKSIGGAGDFVLLSGYKQIANFPSAFLLSNKEIDTRSQKENRISIKEMIKNVGGPAESLVDYWRKKYLPKSPSDFKTDYESEKPSSLSLKIFYSGLMKLMEEVTNRQYRYDSYLALAKEREYFSPQKLKARARGSQFNFSIKLNEDFESIRDDLVLQLRKKQIFCDRLWYDAPATKKNQVSFSLAKGVINLPIKGNYTNDEVNILFEHLDKAFEKVKSKMARGY